MHEIEENNRSRNDHREHLLRCSNCGAFLPKQEKTVCKSCGVAQRNYIPSDN